MYFVDVSTVCNFILIENLSEKGFWRYWDLMLRCLLLSGHINIIAGDFCTEQEQMSGQIRCVSGSKQLKKGKV